ncbi:hypothetical protein SARC_12884 [Sphaeroforma arctica JP610]|uniref:Peptidase S74 domain-containing protein n=1 Tax=Sphaeroforma arctica JP610 TaxID=667725 RepID=A0A0L0FCU4_9EUKA|nr:hypothetical protein SARC_12884 [Sphaeroforma arctica JP610]KNC74572.1 hypothetical protein SARC_12884 [Sphaeroforma arctica JP610]|eukprot:XP_014148474.1 hypothetical protein SARC_12884 [Sphaeroforma arctica JP610]
MTWKVYGIKSLFLGKHSGYKNQGDNAVAMGIGTRAGYVNQAPYSAGSFVVKPVRNASGVHELYYNPQTGEVTYTSSSSVTKNLCAEIPVTKIDELLAGVRRLHLRQFTFKEPRVDHDKEGKHVSVEESHYGFLAEDVMAVARELAVVGADGEAADIKWKDLTALLLIKTNRLEAEIVSLHEKLAPKKRAKKTSA